MAFLSFLFGLATASGLYGVEWVVLAGPLGGILFCWMARKAVVESRTTVRYRRSWTLLVIAAVYWNCAWLLPPVVGSVIDLKWVGGGDAGAGGGEALLLGFLIMVAPLVLFQSPFVLYALLKHPPPIAASASTATNEDHFRTPLRLVVVSVPIVTVIGFLIGIGPGLPGLTIAMFYSVVGWWWIARLKSTSSNYFAIWLFLMLATVAYACVMAAFVRITIHDILHAKSGLLDVSFYHPSFGPSWLRILRWLGDEPALGYPSAVWLASLLRYSPWTGQRL